MPTKRKRREARAFEEARSLTPEHTGSKNVFGRAARMEPAEDVPDADETQETQRDADESPRAMQDFITVEHARPDLPSEKEVRHQAEDRDLGWA